jgi:FecR protein
MFKPIRFAALIAGMTLGFSVMAQPAPDQPPPGQPPPDSGAPQADPPTRVARLSFLSGDVSFVPAGENDWVEAQMNRPLITGDKLWTDKNSRTELEIGSSTLRMDQQTSFDFLNLDDKTAQVELTQGTLNLRVRRLYDDQGYEIDTPTLAFVINRVGEYRVDVLGNGQATVVTVLHGGGDTYGEGGARFRVEEGQSVTFSDPKLQNYQSNALPPPDDFDNFYLQRDQRWDNAKSRQFVSEDVIGYQDLDENGDWSDVPEYGNVWYPTTVAVGWSPYHDGHWGWVGAYGWTWVDASPWGFAPFHYGRWAYVGNRWGWCPGPIGVRAVYAPALVAFVGGGVGVSIGFGSGPVGWFPLGPRDVYFPGYHVSERYFSSINISNSRGVNATVVNNFYGGYARGNVDFAHVNYANRNVAGAVTAVPAEAFVGSRGVRGASIAVNQQTFANSRVSGFAAVAPTRASLAPATAARGVPPAGLAGRPVVAATKPPAAPAPFSQNAGLLAKNPGQPLSVAQLHPPVTGGANGGAAAPNSNFHVVTNGVPIKAPAPVIPARPAGTPASTGLAGSHPITTANPALKTPQTGLGATPNTTGGANGGVRPPPTSGQPSVAPTNSAASRLNSSNFAHPTTTNGPTTGTPANGAMSSTRPVTSNGTLPAVQSAHPTTSTSPVTRPVTPLTKTPTTSTSSTGASSSSGYGGHSTGSPDLRKAPTTTTHSTTPSVSQPVTNTQHVNPPPAHVNPPPAQHTPPPPPPPPKGGKPPAKEDDKKHDH